MKKALYLIILGLLIVVIPGAAFAGTHQLLTYTDNSSDTAVPVNRLLMATITTNGDKGGNDATSTQVDVGGTVALADVSEICVQYDGNTIVCQTPTTLTNFSISLGGTEKGGSPWTYYISLNASAAGKTFSLNIDTIVGTDNAVLPAATATRNVTGTCTKNAPSVSITPASQTITSDGGSVNYTVSVTNNDSAACTNTTFGLSATDTDGGTNFVVPSSLVPNSVNLAPGGNTNVTLTVTAQSGVTSASNNTFVDATEATHTTGTSNTVTTDINVSGGCSPAAPSVSVVPSSQTITSDGGSVNYTVTITNNDSGGCPNTTFDLASSDSNSTDFVTPSTLSPGQVTLAEGANTSSTLTVKAVSGKTSGANSTTVQASASGHGNGTSSAVTTAISVAPVGGDGNLLKRSVEETCHSCHKTDQNRTSGDPDWGEAIKTHNSTNLGTSYWSGDGGWGIASGKYGEFGCTTCHTPHATKNLYLVKETITTPVGTWNSTGTSTLNVDFREFAGTASPYPYAMGNDGDNHTTSTRVCEACHSATKYHRYNATTQDSANRTHNNGADCTECHVHQDAFKGTGDCVGCHKQVRTKTLGSGGTIRQVTDDGTGTGDFVRLSRHVSDGSSTEIVTIFDCALCHREGSTIDASPVDNIHNDAGGLIHLRNVDSPTSGWTIDNKSMTETMRTDMDTFCMTCHDSDGANGIAVNGNKDNPAFVIPPTTNAERWGPFNDSDNFRNGRDGFTTRTRVLDVKSQFYNGTGGTGSGYNGNPSQHAVLGGRYSLANSVWSSSAWTNHTTLKGQTLNSTSVRETATLHCADCHLSESNAHGAQNAWHMLQDGTVNNYTNDTAMTGLQLSSNLSINVCYKCHNVNVYRGDNSVTSGVSRMDHDEDSDWFDMNYGSGGEAAYLGSPCLYCHAGDNFGNIHGVSGTYTPSSPTLPPSGTTYNRYRFMPGAWMQWKPGTGGSDADWNTTNDGTCYFPSSSNWALCNHHGGSSATVRNINYGRATKY